MQQAYKIKKNNPITYIPYKQSPTSTNNCTLASPIDNTCSKILIKSIGDNWLQIYEKQKLIDVIALPILCKMDRICFVSQGEGNGGGQGEGEGGDIGGLFWVQSGSGRVGVGRLGEGVGEVSMVFSDVGSCSFVTNAVSLCSGSIINMSQSSSGLSHLNIIKTNSQLKIQQLTINQQLHKNTNISILTHQSLNFISNPSTPTLNTYNLTQETITHQLDLPQTINQPTSLTTLSSTCTTDNPLIYTYCEQWLAISDSRHNKLVAYQPLIGCKTATNIQGGNVVFSSACFLNQYEIRRGQVNRMPKLVHSKDIWDVRSVGNGVMIQDDGMGLYFYQ